MNDIESSKKDLLYDYNPLLLISGLDTVDTNDLSSNEIPPLSYLATKGLPLVKFNTLHDEICKRCEPLKLIGLPKNGPHSLHCRFVDRDQPLWPLKPTKEQVVAPADGSTDSSQLKHENESVHSFISPKNPSCSLYPDGLIDERWVQKYLYWIAPVLVSVHELEPAIDIDDTALKSLIDTILELKSQQVEERGGKLVVMLVGNEDAAVEESRIQKIRKETSLPYRNSIIYFSRNASTEQIGLQLESLCEYAYQSSLDFYSQLSRAIRKRKGKSNVMTSVEALDTSPLSNVGWQVRYDFKLAVMAEFRQEHEVALRLYESAYESTIELFEALDPKNEISVGRWKEARQLLDVIAFKIIKLCMYLGQNLLAHRKFDIHVGSSTALVLNKGYTRESRSYLAWLSIQYFFMAELSSNVTTSKPVDSELSYGLPRPGLLYLSISELIQDPLTETEGDIEDPYSGLMPVNHLLAYSLEKAAADFESAKQSHAALYTLVQKGEMLQSSCSFTDAIECYKKAAKSYRSESWLPILRGILLNIIKCAKELGSDEDTVVALFELSKTQTVEEDITKLTTELDGLSLETIDRPVQSVPLLSSPFLCNYTFHDSEGYVGLKSSLQITLNALWGDIVGDIVVSEVIIEFENYPSITFIHDETHEGYHVSEKANLRFSPGQSKVLQLSLLPKDLGSVFPTSVTVKLEHDKFTATGLMDVRPEGKQFAEASTAIWIEDSIRRNILLKTPGMLRVLPRPPQITLHSSMPTAYVIAGEILNEKVSIKNKENSSIEYSITCNTSCDGKAASFNWRNSDNPSKMKGSLATGEEGEVDFELLVPEVSGTRSLSVEFVISYHVDGDEDNSQIKEALGITVPISKPFLLNNRVEPLYHPESWPSLFDDPVAELPTIKRRWRISASVHYRGEEPVKLLNYQVKFLSDSCECELLASDLKISKLLKPNESTRLEFSFDTFKKKEEIRSAVASAALLLLWKRPGHDIINTFKVTAIKINLPMYEPRVIAEAIKEKDSKFVKIVYHVENVTMLCLTYAVTVGSSEHFAFQGPKHQYLRVLPFSKRDVCCMVMPLSKTDDPVLPRFKAVDTHFKKTLYPLPGTTDLSLNEKGELIYLL